jgi:hypothetical protein
MLPDYMTGHQLTGCRMAADVGNSDWKDGPFYPRGMKAAADVQAKLYCL